MARLNPSARFWKITRLVVGWGLIILIVAGLALLGKDRPWTGRWLEQIKARLKRGKRNKGNEEFGVTSAPPTNSS
jgi:hypothetical protein